MSPIPISKTKIVPPRRRAELLLRKRLLHTLFEALDSKLVLVSAPAGYGKTSLLIDAVEQNEFTCCWLSLDELDRDPQRFLAYLIASIAERFPGVGAQTTAVMSSVSSFEEHMERLAVTLVNETYEIIKEHFVIILDDFHILEGTQPIYDFLNRFVQLADDNCHLVISSRALTALEDLPLMVAYEQVGGLSYPDLAFRPEEIQALMLRNNIRLSDEEAQKWIEETEGWITGLQFSGLGVRGKDRKPGLNVELSDYLGQQVIDRQRPEMRAFLLRTSLMDEFDPSLCEAVLSPFHAEKQDWDALIQSIIRNNLFALPVGPEGGSLRYHHLVRDYLRKRMRKERPDEVQPILKRLSRAYESLEEWEKAYAVINELADTSALVELIELASFNNLQNTGRFIEQWLRDLPSSILKTNPNLLSIVGTLKLVKGEYHSGVNDLEEAIAALRKNENISQLALTLVRLSFGHRYLGDYPASVKDTDEAIRLITDNDNLQSLHAEALHVKGASLMRMGQNRAALKCLEHALDLVTRFDKRNDIPAILSDIGAAHQALGNYAEAELNLKKALGIWKQEANLMAQAGLLNNLGYMFHQEGEYQKAAATYEDGLLCARRSQHTRMEALISIGLGDLYTELGDPEIAEQNYARAAQLLEDRNDIFLLISLHFGRVNLALFQRDFPAAENGFRELETLIRPQQSHYENGHFDLLQGKYFLLNDCAADALSKLESAEAHFIQDGQLLLDLTTTRIWLAAAYTQLERKQEAAAKLFEAINPTAKIRHAAVLAAIQTRAQLTSLQPQADLSRLLRSLLAKADALNARIPDDRRELRRQARVVEVPAARIRIRGFGHGTVIVNDRELGNSDFQTQSVRELFFFFLSQNRALTKDQLMDQFWRSVDDPVKVRQRFKNEIYRLRRAVGSEVIRFENQSYFFDRTLNYEYDVEDFYSHLARARSAQSPGERMDWYRRAIALVNAPYLETNYLDWALADRNRLDQAYLSALTDLADLCLKEAQFDEALALCQRAIHYTPYYETAYRIAMQVHARLADRAAVAVTYEACKTALRKHLNTSPSPETETLYRKLMT